MPPSGGVNQIEMREACDQSPRDSCSFSTLSNFSAGLSPGREYSCLRAISANAASRSAAVPIPVRLVPVRAEQLAERIARLERDAHAEGTLNARVGPTQVVRSRNTHEFSVRQVPKAALGYEASRARASSRPRLASELPVQRGRHRQRLAVVGVVVVVEHVVLLVEQVAAVAAERKSSA